MAIHRSFKETISYAERVVSPKTTTARWSGVERKPLPLVHAWFIENLYPELGRMCEACVEIDSSNQIAISTHSLQAAYQCFLDILIDHKRNNDHTVK